MKNKNILLTIAIIAAALVLITVVCFFFFSRRAAREELPPRVEIPAGAIILGCDPENSLCESDELAPGGSASATLSAFSIDINEVTNELYYSCVAAGECDDNRGGFCTTRTPGGRTYETATANLSPELFATSTPAVCVSYAMAEKYCAHARGQLPSADQWEKAARGADGRIFPWGNTPAAQSANMRYNDSFASTSPPGAFPAGASPYGVMDMAGNVWEWTTECRGANCPERAVRGGSYRWGIHEARVTNRAWLPPLTRSDEAGFRCVYEK